MKIKQLLSRLLIGVSNIYLVEVMRYGKLIDTIERTEILEQDYHDLGDEKINSFAILGTKIVVHIG